MKAGRELDALVAEKVFGMHRHPNCDLGDNLRTECYGTGPEEGYGALLEYSTDISAAWQVVEKLALQGRALALQAPGSTDMNEYYARFDRWTAEFQGQGLCPCGADTAPLAICLAALKAVGVGGGGHVAQK